MYMYVPKNKRECQMWVPYW